MAALVEAERLGDDVVAGLSGGSNGSRPEGMKRCGQPALSHMSRSIRHLRFYRGRYVGRPQPALIASDQRMTSQTSRWQSALPQSRKPASEVRTRSSILYQRSGPLEAFESVDITPLSRLVGDQNVVPAV